MDCFFHGLRTLVQLFLAFDAWDRTRVIDDVMTMKNLTRCGPEDGSYRCKETSVTYSTCSDRHDLIFARWPLFWK